MWGWRDYSRDGCDNTLVFKVSMQEVVGDRAQGVQTEGKLWLKGGD